MSLHSEILGQAGGELLFDTNGDSAIYVAQGGIETPLTAIIGNARIDERTTQDGKKKITVRDVSIWSQHTVYGGVAAPALNAQIAIAGELWNVTAIAVCGPLFRLTVQKTGQRYKIREEYFVK